MSRSIFLLPGVLLGLAAGVSPVFAEQPAYNQVALRAEVGSEVANDRMHVVLYSEAQHKNPAQLAADTTRLLNEALNRARQNPGITVRLGSRNSYPVYDANNRFIESWRERAEVRLESTDFARLSQLTGDLLQGGLKMGGMHFSVSDAIRKQNEDALFKDAVTAFRARAQLVTEALGGSGYKVVSLNLNSSINAQPVMRGMAMKAELLAGAPAPEIEAGTEQIGITAEGIIEVQPH